MAGEHASGSAHTSPHTNDSDRCCQWHYQLAQELLHLLGALKPHPDEWNWQIGWRPLRTASALAYFLHFFLLLVTTCVPPLLVTTCVPPLLHRQMECNNTIHNAHRLPLRHITPYASAPAILGPDQRWQCVPAPHPTCLHCYRRRRMGAVWRPGCSAGQQAAVQVQRPAAAAGGGRQWVCRRPTQTGCLLRGASCVQSGPARQASAGRHCHRHRSCRLGLRSQTQLCWGLRCCSRSHTGGV